MFVQLNIKQRFAQKKWEMATNLSEGIKIQAWAYRAQIKLSLMMVANDCEVPSKPF